MIKHRQKLRDLVNTFKNKEVFLPICDAFDCLADVNNKRLSRNLSGYNTNYQSKKSAARRDFCEDNLCYNHANFSIIYLFLF